MTSNEKQTPRVPRWALYLPIMLLMVFSAFFLLEFVITTQLAAGRTPEELTPETYMERVTALLADADPQRGPELLDFYACMSCHAAGMERIAPSFEGLADHAAERRPPLQAAAYIYEAIVDPAAYVLEGYNNLMPANYDVRLSDEELGDILAYLLTKHAED